MFYQRQWRSLSKERNKKELDITGLRFWNVLRIELGWQSLPARANRGPRLESVTLRRDILNAAMAAVLQTFAVLMFSGFLFSLSLGNDSPWT